MPGSVRKTLSGPEGVANTHHKNKADWSCDGLGIRGAVRLFHFTVNYCSCGPAKSSRVSQKTNTIRQWLRGVEPGTQQQTEICVGQKAEAATYTSWMPSWNFRYVRFVSGRGRLATQARCYHETPDIRDSCQAEVRRVLGVTLIPFIPNDALRYITLAATLVTLVVYFLRRNTLGSRVGKLEDSMREMEDLFSTAADECDRDPYFLARTGLKLAMKSVPWKKYLPYLRDSTRCIRDCQQELKELRWSTSSRGVEGFSASLRSSPCVKTSIWRTSTIGELVFTEHLRTIFVGGGPEIMRETIF
ncbi:hypothetical protein B0H14DRAFT_3592062 [Mycena olivaceomarginata]|nr:hypothetical protein B0H14DRAFT_3592062 [Mycena olivaceomarginata]